MLYTALNKPPRKHTPEGRRYIKTYQEVINKDGKKGLEWTGDHNVYDEIQTYADECKIEKILQRVAMGDLAALQQREATYIDATTMPKSLMEAQNLAIRMKDEFYKMPLEVRREFDNSPDKYVSLMGTEEFKNIMAPYNEKILAISKEKNDKEYRQKVKDGAKLNLDIEREMAAQKGAIENEQK